MGGGGGLLFLLRGERGDDRGGGEGIRFSRRNIDLTSHSCYALAQYFFKWTFAHQSYIYPNKICIYCNTTERKEGRRVFIYCTLLLYLSYLPLLKKWTSCEISGFLEQWRSNCATAGSAKRTILEMRTQRLHVNKIRCVIILGTVCSGNIFLLTKKSLVSPRCLHWQ